MNLEVDFILKEIGCIQNNGIIKRRGIIGKKKEHESRDVGWHIFIRYDFVVL